MYPYMRIAMHLFASGAFLCLLVHPVMAQNLKKKLTVTLNPTSVNIGGTVLGRVAHNASPDTSVTVTLTSSPTDSVTMPATVTIPSGNAEATFPITAGAIPRAVTITAAAGGFQSGSANLTITAPPLPNMAYGISLFHLDRGGEVYDVNNQLQVVGHYLGPYNGTITKIGFLYDFYEPNQKVRTLADLISVADMTVLSAEGFTKSVFRGINDDGIVVGYVESADGSKVDGIIIDTFSGALKRSSSFVNSNNSFLIGINNWRDLVGGYVVTPGNSQYGTFVAVYKSEMASFEMKRDFGQTFPRTESTPVITDTRLVKLGGYSEFETAQYDFISGDLTIISQEGGGLSLTGLGESGQYVGYETVVSKSNRRLYPIAIEPSGEILWRSASQGYAYAINDPSDQDLNPESPESPAITVGDILFDRVSSNRIPLYLGNPKFGEINIDNLIHKDDPLRDTWLRYNGRVGYVPQMTQKLEETNWGAIAGKLSNLHGQYMFLLVPVPYAR